MHCDMKIELDGKVIVLLYLSNCTRKNMDDLLMGRGHHTLPVNLDDAVAHSDSTPFCNTPPHQTADLPSGECNTRVINIEIRLEEFK